MSNIHFDFDADHKRNSGMNRGLRRLLTIGLVLLVLVALGITVYKLFSGGKKDQPKPLVIKTEDIPAKTTIHTPLKKIEDIRKTVKPAVPAPQTPLSDANVIKFEGRKITEIINEARQLNEQKEFGQARKLLDPVLDSGAVKLFSAEWLAVAEELSKANSGIFFTDLPFPPHKLTYIVKRGDTLDRIATEHNTTIEGVQKSNGIKETSSMIQLGAAMRIYKGDWRILVSRQQYLLILFDGEQVFKIYRIGVGRQDRTPNGLFKVSSKIKEPAWYAPDGKIIPYGTTENQLGTRWLALTSSGKAGDEVRGLGIHGTWEPETIGTNKSNGCIRMRNEDVEDLYSIVPRLIPVEITD